MAKKGKGKRHHRRVHGLSSMLNPRSPIIIIGALAAGFFLGDTINTAIDKFNTTPATGAAGATTKVPSAMILVGELGLGGLLLLKKKKNLVTVGLGGILAGAGIRRGMRAAGMITGYQSVPVVGRRMGAYQSVPVIGRVPAQLAGTPAQLQGFRVNGNNGYVPVGSGANVMGSVGPIAGSAAYQSAYSGGSGYMN